MVEEVSVVVSALGAAVVVVVEAGGEGAEPGAARPRTRRYQLLQDFIIVPFLD